MTFSRGRFGARAAVCLLATLSVIGQSRANLGFTAPTTGKGTGTGDQSQNVPLKDFSFLLTFTEVVQGGEGSLTIDDAQSTPTQRAKIDCGTGPDLTSKYAVVPVTSELFGGPTASERIHKVRIPSACFRNVGGESMAQSAELTNFDFTTIAKGGTTDILSTETGSPEFMIGTKAETENTLWGISCGDTDCLSHTPSLPANGAWVPTTQAFTLYFTEFLQAGSGSVTIEKTTGAATSVHETFASTTSAVDYTLQSIPGKIKITPTALKTGAEYTIGYSGDAFKDLAGNMILTSSVNFGDLGYKVKVSTKIMAGTGYYPADGAAANVTVGTNIVLTFADEVKAAATTELMLCESWTKANACASKYPGGAAVSTMHFLGKTVIANPNGNLKSGQEYNVSIPGTSISYFAGLSANANRAWSYQFTTECATCVDTGKPELVAALVDCDGDGKLADTNSPYFSESCDPDYDGTSDFMEIGGSVTADTPMLTDAHFMLYFKEKVEVGSKKVTVQADDSTTAATLTPTVGTGKDDCVVTIDPGTNLKPGKLYTLNVPAKAITDSATLKNEYDGTSFTFYTPFPRPKAVRTDAPANAATGQPLTQSILVAFGGSTENIRLGLDSSKQSVDFGESKYSMSAADKVKIQGTNMLIVPPPPLKPSTKYEVKLPKHSIRYMTQDYSFSFTTRAVDTTKPSVVYQHPAQSTTLTKTTLDTLAPFVVFSEGVQAVTGKKVKFAGSSGKPYLIDVTDTTCGTGGATGDACVELDALNNKLAMYPLGKDSNGKASAWATAGLTYTVEIPSGAFMDQPLDSYDTNKKRVAVRGTGAEGSNPNDAFSGLTFDVNTDSVGPTVVHSASSPKITPSAANFQGGLYKTQNSIFLTFNEAITSGSATVYRGDYVGTAKPAPISQALTTNKGTKMAYSISFDTPIVGGTAGSFQGWNSGTATAVTNEVAATDASFVGNKVIFKPAHTMHSATSYYVKSSATSVLKQRFGGTSSLDAALDTSTYDGMAYFQDIGTDSIKPAVLWSSVEDYSCLGADGAGVLPEIVLYMNEDMKQIKTNTFVKLYDCGADCDLTPPFTAKDTPTWSLQAFTASKTTTIKVSFPNAKNYKISFGTKEIANTNLKGTSSTPLTPSTAGIGSSTGLLFGEGVDSKGMFVDGNSKREKTPVEVVFSFCESKFDTPSSSVMRLYVGPSSTPFASGGGVPKMFQVAVTAGIAKDALGNTGNAASSFMYTMETTAPTLVIASSGLAEMVEQESIVLSFNEVVQATNPPYVGSACDAQTIVDKSCLQYTDAGSFQIWDAGAETDFAKFDISLGRLTNAMAGLAGSKARLTGRTISFHPRTHCDGTPACSHLVASKTYYVKTTRAGMLRDKLGTKMGSIDTKTTMKFTTAFGTHSTKKPEIAYVGDREMTSTNTVTGYIYFTEQIQDHKGNTGTLSILDCGGDYSCGTAPSPSVADNSAALADGIVSYGDGSATDGSKDYGMLKYVKVLPLASRRYKISVPLNLVKDSGMTGTERTTTGCSSCKAGPSAAYSFYINAGTIPSPSPDATAPTLTYKSPTSATPSLAKTSNVVLYFNEEVQAGTTGKVQFCTNDNADEGTTGFTPACTSGQYYDGGSATYDITHASVDRRFITINPTRDLKMGQKLYVLMPKSSAKDLAGNTMASTVLKTNKYYFKTADEDVVTGTMQWFTAPTVSTGTLTLFFSEAVQKGGTWADAAGMAPQVLDYGSNQKADLGVAKADTNWPKEISDITNGDPALAMTTTISGNKVSFTKTWTAGRKYGLNFLTGTFKDLMGLNVKAGAGTLAGRGLFHIPGDNNDGAAETATTSDGSGNEDSNAPYAYTLSPSSPLGATADANDIIAVMFSEIVQRGTGSLQVYSKRPNYPATNTGGDPKYKGGCSTHACTGGTVFMNADVSSFPLLTGVNSVTKYAASVLVVQPSSTLQPDSGYSLKVPSTAFKDLSGNAFTGLTSYGAFPVYVTSQHDTTQPRLVATDIAAADQFFSASTITMYFSEAVQKGTGTNAGVIALSAYNGGSNCGAFWDDGTAAAKILGSENTGAPCGFQYQDTADAWFNDRDENVYTRKHVQCNTACGFGASASTAVLTNPTYSGASVTAVVPTLQKGKGYKLSLHANTFKDIQGLNLRTYDAASSTAGGYHTNNAFKYILSPFLGDSEGPQHKTGTGTYHPIADSHPSYGGTLVQPSTSVQITFTENVQAGDSSEKISYSTSEATYVSDCMFSGSVMTCDPPGELKRNTEYTVTYTTGAVKDQVGNTLKRTLDTVSKLHFTTIDLDYTPPKLAALGGSSYARRLASTPYDPYHGQENVARGTVLSLTFSETVQVGSGAMYVYKCKDSATPNTFSGRCAAVDGSQMIEVNGNTAYTKLYFSGSSVYLDRATRQAESEDLGGKLYSVHAAAGAFQDANSQPSVPVNNFMFTVITDDTAVPAVKMATPRNDAGDTPTPTPDDAPSTDITLYFSEGVQASSASGKHVTVTDGSATGTIPVDNTNPNQGAVSITDTAVVVDPFDDMGYDKTVTVTVEAESFTDYYGNLVAATTATQFKTVSFGFTLTKNHNMTHIYSFPPREGATLYYTAGKLMLYGGKKGATCMSDLYTSSIGLTWEAGAAGKPGEVAYAPSAQDADSCVWTLGGQCGGAGTAQIYKTCDAGVTWTNMPESGDILSVPNFNTLKAGEAWPKSFSGHAIAILGGWQLIVVDSVGGKVWQFKTKAADTVAVVADSVPFASRRDPILVTSSDNKLYLMGGHNCDESDETCKDNDVFTDVWLSPDAGATWVCQTANWVPDNVDTYSRNVGRFTSVLMAHDDTIFLMGGHKPNSTLGLNKLYVSAEAAPDTTFAATYDSVPLNGATGVHKTATATLMFTEAIQTATNHGLRVRSLGSNGAAGATDSTTNADSDVAGVAYSVSRQVLTITPGTMTAGYAYSVIIPDGGLMDVDGNKISSFGAYKFTVNADAAGPTLSSVNPSSTSAAPWTTVTLTMNEAVQVGTGSIKLDSVLGVDVDIEVSDSQISGSSAFFELPTGTRLTEGEEYTVLSNVGAFQDLQGNTMAASGTANKFTVLSGSVTSASDGYSGDLYNDTFVSVTDGGAKHYSSDPVPAAPGPNASVTADTTAPTMTSAYPPHGAKDVPIPADTEKVSVVMFFNEPVDYNETGFISVINGSDIQVASFNITHDRLPSSAGGPEEKALRLVRNGTKMVLPANVLKKSGVFTISVPDGVILDLAGNKLKPVTTSFTCLAMAKDTTGPTVTMMHPPNGDATVMASALSRVSIWFDEDVEAATGTIDLKYGTSYIKVPIDSSQNVTISGPKITVDLFPTALGSGTGAPLNTGANSFYLQIPAGTLTDKSRPNEGGQNQFKGQNGTAMAFKSVNVDSAAPTLSSKTPAAESADGTTGLLSGYANSISSKVALTFSETVQAVAGGTVTLTPKWLGGPHFTVATDGGVNPLTAKSGATSFSVDGDEVTLTGSVAVVTPKVDLLPGEEYTVSISVGAFSDVQGNAYAGLTDASYKFSTRSKFKMVRSNTATATHWGQQLTTADMWGNGDPYLDGRRWGAAAAVTPDNKIFLIGGRNGTFTHKKEVLNDVFTLTTYRDVNCAASYVEVDATACTPPCDANGITMGKAAVKMTIWRTPTAGGLVCKTSTGKPMTAGYAQVATDNRDCDCPLCLGPPGIDGGDLPSNMVNESYVSAYTMVRAGDDTSTTNTKENERPLYCKPGLLPDATLGAFKCTTTTTSAYFGEFAPANMPVCVPKDCDRAMPLADITNLHSTGASLCGGDYASTALKDFGPNMSLPHNKSCEIKCIAGYKSEMGKMECLYGEYSAAPLGEDAPDPSHKLPTCEPQSCAKLEPSDAMGGDKMTVDCDSLDDKLGTKCTLSCDPGYELVGDDSVTCETTSTEPEAVPTYATASKCQATKCGAVEFEDEDGVVTEEGANYGDMDSTATVGCSKGKPSADSDEKFTCEPESNQPGAVNRWKGSLKCEATDCAAPSSVDNGELDCGAAPYAIDAECTLTCNNGYTTAGSTALKCGGGGTFEGDQRCVKGGDTCAAPPKGAGMSSTGCDSGIGDGGTCTPECEDGYSADGEFSCVKGAYVAAGVCLGAGEEVVTETFVESSLTVGLTLPEGTDPDELASDPAFKANVQGAIADGIGKDPESVIIDKITITLDRRLREGRRLAAASMVVDFRVKVADASEASTISQSLGGEGGDTSGFVDAFTTSLQDKVEGLEVTGVEIAEPKVQVVKTTKKADDGGDKADDDEGGGGGAMIGGIVGGGVGLVAIGGGAFFFMKKKQGYQAQE